MQFPSPLTYDLLVDTGVFMKNHIADDDRGYDGLLFETYGPELEYVLGVAAKAPQRVATLLECGDGMFLASGCRRVDRVGYFVASEDLPDFAGLPLDAVPDEEDVGVGDPEMLIKAAEMHGRDDDPEHEVGDLQAFLRALLESLDASRKKEVFLSEGMICALSDCLCKEPVDVRADMRPTDFSAECLFAAAKEHGTDTGEPDHEIGDLQAFLRAGFAQLYPSEISRLYALPQLRETLAAALGITVDELSIELPKD